MKKHLFYISSALLGLLSVNSCMSELEKDVDRAGQVPEHRVHLTVQAGTPEMKTYIEGTSPKWYNGDNLGVFFDSWSAGATAVDGTLSNSAADAEKAVFEGDVTADEGTHTVYAFYPARAFYATEAEKIVNMEIPYIQFPSTTSFDPKADLLVSVPQSVDISGTSATIENMKFRRIGSIVKVCLTDATTGTVLSSEKVKSVKIESSAFDLAGAFSYDFANEDAAATQILAASAKKHVTADFTESPVAFDSNIYIITNPVTLTSGSTLTFTVLTEGHEVIKVVNLPSDVELESSKIVTFNLTLNDSCTLTHVYFQDNFDWVYKYWDEDLNSAYGKSKVITDPVANSAASHQQPNVWGSYSSTIGKAFTTIGYKDLDHEASGKNNTLYILENYIKIGATAKQTALQLPPIAFGNVPVNVTLSFKWCRHMSGAGNIDAVPLVVEVLNQGKCADTDATTSEVFTTTQSKGSLLWTNASIVLKNVTNSTRIVFKENYDTFNESGVHRFHLDDIKITEAAPTPVEFPIVWSFPEESSTWVKGEDFFLHNNSGTGTYVYSDDHSGKVSVIRAGSSDTMKSATYISRGGVTFEGNTLPDEVQLLTYGMGPGDDEISTKEGSYWLFEIPNVMNPAGTYNITYKTCASGGGPKYFRLEYTLDDDWNNPVAIEATNTARFLYNDDSSDIVNYTYATPSNNEAVLVNSSFHLDNISSLNTLKIRAMVVSRINCKQDGNVAVNTTGTNRLLGTPTISFTPDSPLGVSYYHGGTYGD